MTEPIALLTESEVAQRLRITESQVAELRRKHNWPCVRLSHKAIRFTEEHVAQIVQQHAADVPAAASKKGLPGQTAASKRRAS